jgi:hypothetical protein
MFEQAGHQVHTRRALTPALADRAGTIVWFPDSFAAPPEKVVRWFNKWLAQDPKRTLIYVGRDFDSARNYWDAVIPGAPANQASALQSRRTEAQQDASLRRSTAKDDSCRWFKLDYSGSQRPVDVITGPWSAGVDPKLAKMELQGKVRPNSRAPHEALLESRGDLLAWRFQPERGGGRIVFVSNGSFLLNFPLVNHEHRKLAARLVAEVDPASRVVFVESDSSGLPILPEEPSYKIPSGLAMFTVWPINILLLHLAVLGVVLCVCWWPIFGRPRAPAREAVSDFSRHVDALGEMLELTKDHGYATIRVLQYQQALRGEAVPPSALRGVVAAPPGGQTTGATIEPAKAGSRGSPPARGTM